MNNKDVLPVSVKAVVPTATGTAVFLGDEEKVFVIHVDPLVGSAIGNQLGGAKSERPLTHDLMAMILTALGAKVDRVIINDIKGSTYYARMIISAENELQQRKVVELDARPSDCLAMAARQNSPIYVTRQVWDEAEDMSGVLRDLMKENEPKEGDGPETGEGGEKSRE
jgi:bifunctional DNase/RNase